MTEKLRVCNISKAFGEKQILDDINIYLNEGEIISLLGVSGVGKSTLFNIISGLLMPDGGKVLLNGEDITGVSGKISYMLQKDLLLPYKTVVDNVALPMLIRGMNKKKAREKASEKFELFGLSGCEKKYPNSLSGGMRQRAALLRTYMFSDEVALLDEPFSALDAITKNSIHSWYIDIIKKIKLSTIFITHDIDEAILLSDRIYIMSGSPGKIKNEIKIFSPRVLGNDFLLTENFLQYKKQILSILSDRKTSL